jgi:DNA-binding GntR family transcriptional regulator
MDAAGEIRARSLSSQIYARLRQDLMSARLQPGERIKIRDLALALGTSETPVREALIQLVKDGALETRSGRFIRVRQLSFDEYLELRKIRLVLEPYAAVEAIAHVDSGLLAELSRLHDELIAAEQSKNYPAALQRNYDFHFTLYRRSDMPQLTEILERLWIQVGPLLNYLYPHGHPMYDGPHQHLNILAALEARDAGRLGIAIQQDLIEGGRSFVRYLAQLEGRSPEDALTGAA